MKKQRRKTQGEGELAAQRLRDHAVVQGDRFADLVASLAALGQARRSA